MDSWNSAAVDGSPIRKRLSRKSVLCLSTNAFNSPRAVCKSMSQTPEESSDMVPRRVVLLLKRESTQPKLHARQKPRQRGERRKPRFLLEPLQCGLNNRCQCHCRNRGEYSSCWCEAKPHDSQRHTA